MVLGSSRAARMSERDLGAYLTSSIDGGLTPEVLARLKDWLCEPPMEVGFPAPQGTLASWWAAPDPDWMKRHMLVGLGV